MRAAKTNKGEKLNQEDEMMGPPRGAGEGGPGEEVEDDEAGTEENEESVRTKMTLTDWVTKTKRMNQETFSLACLSLCVCVCLSLFKPRGSGEGEHADDEQDEDDDDDVNDGLGNEDEDEPGDSAREGMGMKGGGGGSEGEEEVGKKDKEVTGGRHKREQTELH